MMRRKYLVVIVTLGLCLSVSQTAFPYYADFHTLITKEAVEKSELEKVLKTELGFRDGLNERFEGPHRWYISTIPPIGNHEITTKSAREWIR
jgi:hypothetical protein